MPIYTIKFINKQLVAEATYVFTFEKPEGFNFVPGQYGGFTLIQPKNPEFDKKSINRRFSFLSTPEDDTIQILTRMQPSQYKEELRLLKPGESLKLVGPSGNFVLAEESVAPIVLIAGGVGIAPFYSMIRHLFNQKKSQPLFLFYGNQSLNIAPFIQDLKSIADQHPPFTFIPTLDQAEPGWSGEVGFISPTMLKKYLPDVHQPDYFICGSPHMVFALKDLLLEMEIVEEKIKIEDFPGY